MRVIITLAAAETVLEVLVVFVVRVSRLGVDLTLSVGLWIYAQCTWRGGWETRCTAIAGEVSLVEKFHQCMFAVALYRAGVAHAGCVVRVGGVLWRRIAGYAGEDDLAERP
jgi:hypothetical protein